MKKPLIKKYDVSIIVNVGTNIDTEISYKDIEASTPTLAIKKAIDKYEKEVDVKVVKLVAIPKLVKKVEVVYNTREINKWLNKRRK